MRAQSMAVSPAPTTATRSPMASGRPSRTERRKAMPSSTPSASSPGMPRRLATWAPTATRMGPKPWARRLDSVKSWPASWP